ncbi:phage GP46 family protein [Bradyrhizobium sp. SZCCHNR3118]|uniref:phage GP46 family protein n=1 Tax=Bradyrhizobium sp. SZCCHNR3118 TaxID=3057468 RepID=UPI0029161F5D|nr:phage GP46 family protein [Bradyrhizobium sp. SZCCHNR3118]
MASPFLIRINDGCAADYSIFPDKVWSTADGIADMRLAGADEPFNRGGLKGRAAILSAVTLALFSDARCPPNHPLAYLADGDQRGYWGDGIDVRADLYEQPLGSLLYLLERAPLTIAGRPASDWAKQFAIEALAPLKNAGVCVRVDLQAAIDPYKSMLTLAVQLYGRDGSIVFDATFQVFWDQVAGASA